MPLIKGFTINEVGLIFVFSSKITNRVELRVWIDSSINTGWRFILLSSKILNHLGVIWRRNKLKKLTSCYDWTFDTRSKTCKSCVIFPPKSLKISKISVWRKRIKNLISVYGSFFYPSSLELLCSIQILLIVISNKFSCMILYCLIEIFIDGNAVLVRIWVSSSKA